MISTPGVVRSLGDEEGNLVSCVELDKIREGLASGLLLRPHPNVSVGARVRIRAGIFEGVEGVVTEFRQQCKVIIALAAVQQCFSLEVELGDIEVLKKPTVQAQPLALRCVWPLELADCKTVRRRDISFAGRRGELIPFSAQRLNARRPRCPLSKVQRGLLIPPAGHRPAWLCVSAQRDIDRCLSFGQKHLITVRSPTLRLRRWS